MRKRRVSEVGSLREKFQGHFGHVDLAGGGKVFAAGEVQIVNGQVYRIDNGSGSMSRGLLK